MSGWSIFSSRLLQQLSFSAAGQWAVPGGKGRGAKNIVQCVHTTSGCRAKAQGRELLTSGVADVIGSCAGAAAIGHPVPYLMPSPKSAVCSHPFRFHETHQLMGRDPVSILAHQKQSRVWLQRSTGQRPLINVCPCWPASTDSPLASYG